MNIPHKISAKEAVRLIAGREPAASGTYWRDLSKQEMQALARAACLTEGLTWETEFGTNGAEHTPRDA